MLSELRSVFSETEFLITILIQYKQTSDENKENITKGILNWSNTKFSKITSQELYGKQ